jgi:SPP1 family predicted phage head-tail adaptor
MKHTCGQCDELSAGTFDRRVTIQKIKTSPSLNALGEADLTDDANWETHCVRWASVDTQGGREFWKRQRVQAEVDQIFRVRYDSTTKAITPRMRVLDDQGVKREIKAAFDVDAGHRIIEIQTVAIV